MLARCKKIEQQIKLIQQQLKKLPEGKLLCSYEGPYVKWYRSDGHKKKYISKKDRILAEQLAQKTYLQFLVEDLEKEKLAIDFYLRHYPKESGKADKLLAESSEFQNLLSPYFSPLSKELDDWMKSPYQHNLKHPEHLTQKISATEFVRSKSEAMIAKVLKQNKIPYRYENQLILNDVELYPDFTIRHPKTGEYFYWEHFGLLHKVEYVKNMHTKMQLYTSNHIMPGIQLITTYETKEKPLTFEMVELLVNYYFC